MFAGSNIPEPLARGTVRPGQIIFLFLVIFAVTGIFAYKVTVSAAPDFRQPAMELVAHASAALLILFLSIVVPDLRRSIPALSSRGAEAMRATDVLAFLAVMLTWAYGAHRLLVLYPVLRWKPELFSLAGYVERVPEISPTYWLLWLLSVGIMAPLAEELLFRGYLMNLWRKRFGLWPGILLSSLAFGAIHFQAAIYAFVTGIFFSLVYLRYGSLWPGTLLHGLYNVVATPLWFGFLILVKDKARIADIASWIPEIVLTLAFFPLLLFFWRRFRPA
jgi:membrane protease YdiL (CAAX protease family)